MHPLFEKYFKLQVSALNSMKDYTCVLVNDTYHNERNNKIEIKVIGTGVFIQIQNDYFLVSASHVLNELENLRIPMENGTKEMLKPGGILWLHELDKLNDGETDPIDVAFLHLDKESVEHILEFYKFLQEEDIAMEHQFTDQPYYTFLGYPTTLTKLSTTKKSYHATTFWHMSTPLTIDNYPKLKTDPNLNVITSFDRKNSYNVKTGKYTTSPYLHGISGCGLWYTNPLDVLKDEIKPILTAIMTDWPIKNRTIVIGTRIDIVVKALMESIHKTYP